MVLMAFDCPGLDNGYLLEINVFPSTPVSLREPWDPWRNITFEVRLMQRVVSASLSATRSPVQPLCHGKSRVVK